MTVEDLLRHTAGLVYGVGNTKVAQSYKSLYGKTGVFRRDKTLADFVSGLAKLPLAHQPGEVWDYGLSVDVLARVVEVASGRDRPSWTHSPDAKFKLRHYRNSPSLERQGCP